MEEKKMLVQKADEATRKELNLEEIEKVAGGLVGDGFTDWEIKEMEAEWEKRRQQQEILKYPAMDPFGAAQQAAEAIQKAHDEKYGH